MSRPFVPVVLRLSKAATALVLCLGGLGVLTLLGSQPAGADDPMIVSVSPASGAPSGGMTVDVHGTNLSAASEVDFGAGNEALITSNAAAEIVVTAPSAPAGCTSFPCTVDVTVTTGAGSSPISTNDEFTYEAAPTVTQLVGGSAPTTGGNTILIVGTNLLGASAVDFNTTSATSFTVVSDSVISAVTPAVGSNAAATTYNVTVTTGAGTSPAASGNAFYWFGGGSCAFSGPGVVDSGAPPGSSAYVSGAPDSTESLTGAVTTGSPTLTDSSADFTDADVGLGVAVSEGGGSGNPLVTSVASVDSPTSITMATDARATIASATYAVGDAVGTSCTGLQGLGLSQPFIESQADPEAAVVTGSGPDGNGGNESWLGWSGANGYAATAGTSYTAPGAGFVLPDTGPSTSGGCPLSPAICVTAASETTPYYATDPAATCPPSQAQVDAGFVDCTVTAGSADGEGHSYDAGTLAVHYADTPTPDAPTVSFDTTTPDAGDTVTVTGGSNWWGSAAGGSPGFAAGVGPTGSATAIPAPTVWVGPTRATAVEASSDLTITPSSYVCTGGGAYTTTVAAAANPAACTLGQGAISGTFVVPTNVSGENNVYIDEPNTTLTQGEYSGPATYNDGLAYDLVNAVESSTPLTVSNAATAPFVNFVSPDQGPASGGQSVTLTGFNFTGATAVDFGATPATAFTVDSDSSITATVPAGTGTVDVTVTTPTGGTSAIAPPGDQYAYLPAPTVESVVALTGSEDGGDSVTITGTGFSDVSAVDFGADNPSGSWTVVSPTEITTITPASSAGTVDVTVTTPGGTSATSPADEFTFGPTPTVSAVSPATGPTTGGTPVDITGTGFTGATAVDFGATVVTTGITVNSDSSITVTSPVHVPGTVDVEVVTPYGTSAPSSADEFSFFGIPVVSSISPATGSSSGGTSVAVYGTNLTGATAVAFGGLPAAAVTVHSDTMLTATSPAGSGTVDVTVTTPDGTSTPVSGDQFTYAPPPVVTSVSPMTGPTSGGTSVDITGSGFTGTTAVDFGTTGAASVTVNSDSSITVTSPTHVPATVDVIVMTPFGTSPTSSADKFTFVGPYVTKVSPTMISSAGGTMITVTGLDFTGATAVDVGGNGATNVTVASSTKITADAPAGTAGPADVTVTTPVGTSPVATDAVTYQSPAVNRVSPVSGPANETTDVTLTGVQLGTATAVDFGGLAASFTVLSNTSISAVAPAQAAAKVPVTVTTPAGVTSATADYFTYLAPTVTKVTPNVGSVFGGTTVTLTGTLFTGLTAVTFNGVPAESFVMNSSTSITAVSPSGSAGVVYVQVTATSGTSPTATANHFKYQVPAITSITPKSGPSAGGTLVLISGPQLGTATGVDFGSVPSTSVSIYSSTAVLAVSPPGAGTVNVRVTTAPGQQTAEVTVDRFTYT